MGDFKAHIYKEVLDTDRYFIAWSRVVDDTFFNGSRTLGPYVSFQDALNAVVSISSALKPVEVTVEKKGGLNVYQGE